MVICKHFLQGTCRFGENCKFEHQISDSSQSSNSILRQATASSTVPGNYDINTLVRSVTNDMLLAEKGGQWLLSSYAPFKNKPAFPGFEDKSFEEVRWGFYEARPTGSVDQYKLQLQLALQDAMMRVRALQNPTPDLINIIKDMYNTPIQQEGVSANTFGGTSAGFGSAPSVFGQSQPQPAQTGSLFGNPTPSTNMFASPSQSQPSQFSFASSGNSVFGGQMSAPQQQQPQNIFAAASQSMFGGGGGMAQPQQQQQQQQQQSSVFGGNSTFGSNNQNAFSSSTQPQIQTPSLFSNQQQHPMSQPAQQYTSPLFNNQQMQQPQQMHNPFAQPVTTAPTSPFAMQQPQQPPYSIQSTASSLFGVHPTVSSPFAPTANVISPYNNPQPQVPFSGAPSMPFGAHAPASVSQQFGTQQSQPQMSFAPAQQHSSNIFGNSSTSTGVGTVFGGCSEIAVQTQSNSAMTAGSTQASYGGGVNEEAYSKLEELTEDEVRLYESESFEFKNIPEKPPTVQMCF